MNAKKSVLKSVGSLIKSIREMKVIIDDDLAIIYGVSVRRLNEQVRRNYQRFPEDFCFQLTAEEYSNLKSHSATSRARHGGKRKPPLAFTEHGVIMAANILRSQRAIQMSVFVVRAFIKMREALTENRSLAAKLEELEKILTTRLDKHENAISYVLQELKKLREPVVLPLPKRRPIGFGKEVDSKK